MQVTDEMVHRFLNWRLPENFSPDAGITFKPFYNEHTPFGPMKHEPTGTNLLDAVQARAMLEHVLEGGAKSPPENSVRASGAETERERFERWFLDYCGTGPQDAVFDQPAAFWLERRTDGEYEMTRVRDAWTGWIGHAVGAAIQGEQK